MLLRSCFLELMLVLMAMLNRWRGDVEAGKPHAIRVVSEVKFAFSVKRQRAKEGRDAQSAGMRGEGREREEEEKGKGGWFERRGDGGEKKQQQEERGGSWRETKSGRHRRCRRRRVPVAPAKRLQGASHREPMSGQAVSTASTLKGVAATNQISFINPF